MGPESRVAIERPFGAENRRRLLERYFEDAGIVSSDNAWRHVYCLLLWIDRTTGLAHCYESDKSQPGRHWYARSLAVHDWLASAFDIAPSSLVDQIDWLFKQATGELLASISQIRGLRLLRAQKQREAYAVREMPEPGEDPELTQIITETLAPYLSQAPPTDVLRSLTERINLYLGQDNKRKNLVGEGFEDVLAFIVARVVNSNPAEPSWHVKTRAPLSDLPGFHEARRNEKTRRVDLSLVASDASRDTGGRRILATVKWSVRADREEQFGVDFDNYERLEAWGRDFEFVLITNEFDPARLVAAARRRGANAPLFTSVVHVNPDAVRAAYGPTPKKSAAQAISLIDEGRIMSLTNWLKSLA